MKSNLLKSTVLVTAIIALFFLGSSGSGSAKTKAKPYYNRLIVSFKAGVNSKTAGQLIAKAGYLTKKQELGSSVIYIIRPKKSLKQSLRFLRAQSQVRFASADYKRHFAYSASDPAFSSSQWSLDAMKIAGVWNQAESQGWLTREATVAIIDSGIDTDHPDLAANLWVNSDEVADNGLDDDNNGFVDDRNGYSWAALNNFALTTDNALDFIQYTSSIDLGADYPQERLQSVAQSVKGTGGKIKSVSLLMERTGTPSKNITVTLTSSSQNKPGGVLASLTITPADIPAAKQMSSTGSISDDWVEKSFSQPVTVSQGQTYFIVISTDNLSGSSFYTLSLNSGYDYYTDGNIFTLRKVGTNSYWTEKTKNDLLFLTDASGAAIEDGLGHGSSVAGIVGAVHNSIGGAGIVPAARIMALKVSNDGGFMSDSSIIEAINYAVNNGAGVINLSLTGPEYSQALEQATDYAYSRGVVVVASAGNDGSEVKNYPAANKNVISVGATTDGDTLAGFSTLSETVDVVAPGTDIYTTDKAAGYTSFDGTSASSPAVAALAALLKIKNPGLPVDAITSRILNTASDLGDVGRDKSFGYGQVNFENVFSGTAFSSINASVNKYVYYRKPVKIRGYLKVGDWVPSSSLAGATLKGYYRPHGISSWLPFAQGITNPSGLVTRYISPAKNTDIRLTWDGNSSYQRANYEFSIKVRPLVHIGLKRKGNKALLRGRVVPKHKGKVGLYRSHNGKKWRKIASMKLDSKGAYSLLFEPRKGADYYRVGIGADSDHASGFSVRKRLRM